MGKVSDNTKLLCEFCQEEIDQMTEEEKKKNIRMIEEHINFDEEE